MKRIISVSRRTDIPAFYGEWFMNRVEAGFAGYVGPIGGQKYFVSLEPHDVICFVFWSKNFAPFLDNLKRLDKLGYEFYFNFTITGLPNAFECNLVETDRALETAKRLAQVYSPKHISWRYDPIIISSVTDRAFHIENFTRMCSALDGYVERCYFSFMVLYSKVLRNTEMFRNETGITITSPPQEFQVELANELAAIGKAHGIQLYTCCGDHLINEENNIRRAHCIDGEIIQKLFPGSDGEFKARPTRKQCGCVASTDIGTYDTCPHGCIYCYANVNKAIAYRRHDTNDPSSPFLGYPKEEADVWVEEYKNKLAAAENERGDRFIQTKLL